MVNKVTRKNLQVGGGEGKRAITLIFLSLFYITQKLNFVLFNDFVNLLETLGGGCKVRGGLIALPLPAPYRLPIYNNPPPPPRGVEVGEGWWVHVGGGGGVQSGGGRCSGGSVGGGGVQGGSVGEGGVQGGSVGAGEEGVLVSCEGGGGVQR